jgi:magnesium chelatase family protein
VRRYRGRVSGPLLDRIDLHVDVPPVPVADLRRREPEPGDRESESAAVRERVERAREWQLERYAGLGIHSNAQLGPRGTRRLQAEPAALGLLERAAAAFHFSARAYHRTLRVARTIADLEGSEHAAAAHVSEALQYRAQTGAPIPGS